MTLKPTLITAPSGDVIALDQAKLAARVDHAEEDALIASFVAAATRRLDGRNGVLGRCLLAQTWRWPAPGGLCVEHHFDLPDAISVAGISYLDDAGIRQSVDASGFVLEQTVRGSALVWGGVGVMPSVSDRVDIDVSFGFGAPADVPEDIKQAIRMMVAHFYEHREAVGADTMAEMPLGAQAMLQPWVHMS